MTIDVDSEHSVVLHGIEWDQCRKIVDALGKYHPRHNFDGADLELKRLLHGVSWEDYSAFSLALGDCNVRHTYDGWTLEMMSPGKDHERTAMLLGRFIEQMTLELRIRIQSVGSMTVENPSVRRSIQPDKSYYVTNEPLVRGKLNFDPTVDPPPDLIIEVDVTNTSVARMPTFGLLGIPEVWRHDAKGLRFFRLNASKGYDEVTSSGEFPWLDSAEISGFLVRQGIADENELVLEFATAAKVKHQAWQSTRNQ